MIKDNGVGKEEKEAMRKWLLKMRIAFEFTTYESTKAIKIRLVDYKNNYEVACKEYPEPAGWRNARYRHSLMKKVILLFEEEEVFPMLFEQYRYKDAVLPESRLIRI
jgi:hypothetical protein